MNFISTKGKAHPVSFLTAMRQGLAPDGGLYMPDQIPRLPGSFWESIQFRTFPDIALNMAQSFLEGELTDDELESVVNDAFQFPVPIKHLPENHHILELFHGPTLAFKDFGARFMARLFSEKARKEQKKVTILVATSGDTGSAVAHGFYRVPGVDVCLLYPKGKVSRLQEMQMTTLGENITAIEIDGVFDDCQKLVKQAFMDKELNRQLQLSSANSINIARLLPQSFYYAFAYAELKKQGMHNPVFSVPSGNFGNLTGGLLAMKMGMPVKHFIAATNVNDVVPEYLRGDHFKPRASKQTISNAMDVGDPSNFVRIRYLFDHDDQKIRSRVSGYSYTDDDTRNTIKDIFKNSNYLMCPHTAIGYRAAREYQKETFDAGPFVTLATAHPVKFRDVIEPEIQQKIEIPELLGKWISEEKKSISLDSHFQSFKNHLLTSLSNH